MSLHKSFNLEKKKFHIVLFLFLSCNIVSFAQKLRFVYDDTVQVSINSKILENPWSGGLQAPEFSIIDADNDGKKDLFVFDRYDNSISIFLNKNNAYHYSPDYDSLFPVMSGWVMLRDYNCDGKEDIFTSSVGGVAVYENTSENGVLSFNKITSFLVTSGGAPILIPFSDIPAIEDVDFDGDLDILTFDGGGIHVVFYKNTSVENSTDCNLLKYDIETICWGDFREGGLNNSITLGDNCGGNVVDNKGERSQDKNVLHSGSSLLAFDNDGDNDMDLVIGDISANNLIFLRNGNNASDAIMDFSIDSFPATKPINLALYVASYYVDVDFDGKRDLIAVPNEGAEASGKNFEQILKYKNTGTDKSPIFTYETNNFLSENTIELGAGAIPRFLDYDNDGDLDLIVGNFSYRTDGSNSVNKLALFENTGTKIAAKFDLKDDDFANTSSLGLFSTSPTFGDLDADGDIDMMLGEFSGKLYYFKNTAGAGNPVNFVLDSINYGGIDVGSNATPVLVDIDKDNDLDLIIGERNGNINYFENLGDSTAPNFLINTDSVGKIRVFSVLINAGYTVPNVLDFNKDNKLDLVLGTYDGDVFFYSNIEDQINTKVNPISNTYYNSKTTNFGNVNYGRRSAPAITDLNGDGLHDMIIGLYRGGMIYLRNESDSTLDIKEKQTNLGIKIFPNPTNGELHIFVEKKTQLQYEIYNLLGRKIDGGIIMNLKSTINIQNQSKGIYLLVLKNKDKIVLNQKLILL